MQVSKKATIGLIGVLLCLGTCVREWACPAGALCSDYSDLGVRKSSTCSVALSLIYPLAVCEALIDLR